MSSGNNYVKIENQNRKLKNSTSAREVIGGRLFLLFLVSTLLSQNCAGKNDEEIVSNRKLMQNSFGRKRTIKGLKNGVVAADIEACSDIGVDIMKNKGGNVIDALVGVILCSGVLGPQGSGIGGGGFIIINFQGQRLVIDGREYAPKNAVPELYQNSTLSSQFGGLAIAVPLEILALENAHLKFGVLPWKELFQPAIKFAEEGFMVTPYFHQILDRTKLFMDEDMLKEYGMLQTFYLEDGQGGYRTPEVGEICCKRSTFANTLKQIAKFGTRALYKGQLGRDLVDDINKAGGVYEYSDIESAYVHEKEPITTQVGDLTFYQPPPPSSGVLIPVAIRIFSKIKSSFENTVLDYHYLIEALKHIFAIRMYFGDERFLDLQPLLNNIRNDEFIINITEQISPDSTFPSGDSYGGSYPPILSFTSQDAGTTHVSIVDKDGNAVAMTSTINTPFGSKVVSQKTGILLNNQMDDFSVQGFANVFGLAPSEANFIVADKKPLSSTSPTIIEKDGRPIMVVGASGGPRIISGMIQLILRVLFGSEDVDSVETSPQIHHQLYPQQVAVENLTIGDVDFVFPNEIMEGLIALNHNVSSDLRGSSRQVVLINMDGSKSAASDPRKDGIPAGY